MSDLTESPSPPPADTTNPQLIRLIALETTVATSEIYPRLEAASRKGRLPGLEPISKTKADWSSTPGVLFSVTDFGSPFEHRLIGYQANLGEGGTGNARQIRFELVMKRWLPMIWAIVMLLTIWPGVWLTASMMETYFPGSLIARWTWWWYLILTVPFLPLAGRSALRKSRASAEKEARELIDKIAVALDGRGLRPMERLSHGPPASTPSSSAP